MRPAFCALLCFIVATAVHAQSTLVDGQEFDDCGGRGWCPIMVVIPAGSFTMGSSADEAGEMPQHTVSVPRFAVSKYEITWKDWQDCFVGAGCEVTTPGIGQGLGDEGWGRTDRPLINVSWDDAGRFVRWLSEATGRQYRLLTEAEWEYAARGGEREGSYWWGATASRDYANYGDDVGLPYDGLFGRSIMLSGAASGRDQWVHTAPIGSFPRNPFGLYDMNGNVAEWVADCWSDNYASAPADGSAWTRTGCTQRVVRGGSWVDMPTGIRSASRNARESSARQNTVGFRVARTL